MDVGLVPTKTGKIEVLGDLRQDGTPIALLYVDCDYGGAEVDLTDIPGIWTGSFVTEDLTIRAICELDAEEVRQLIPMLEKAVTADGA